jgi:hypothetical protein
LARRAQRLFEEKTIGSASSLKSQPTIPHEIIISEGGNKDQTVKIAAKYADKLIVYNEIKRQTIVHGRNGGARAAQGEFLVCKIVARTRAAPARATPTLPAQDGQVRCPE